MTLSNKLDILPCQPTEISTASFVSCNSDTAQSLTGCPNDSCACIQEQCASAVTELLNISFSCPTSAKLTACPIRMISSEEASLCGLQGNDACECLENVCGNFFDLGTVLTLISLTSLLLCACYLIFRSFYELRLILKTPELKLWLQKQSRVLYLSILFSKSFIICMTGALGLIVFRMVSGNYLPAAEELEVIYIVDIITLFFYVMMNFLAFMSFVQNSRVWLQNGYKAAGRFQSEDLMMRLELLDNFLISVEVFVCLLTFGIVIFILFADSSSFEGTKIVAAVATVFLIALNLYSGDLFAKKIYQATSSRHKSDSLNAVALMITETARNIAICTSVALVGIILDIVNVFGYANYCSEDYAFIITATGLLSAQYCFAMYYSKMIQNKLRRIRKEIKTSTVVTYSMPVVSPGQKNNSMISMRRKVP